MHNGIGGKRGLMTALGTLIPSGTVQSITMPVTAHRADKTPGPFDCMQVFHAGFLVGETLDEREKNRTKKVLKKQVLDGFKDITAEDFENIVIAYEPVWAIGTGKTATAEDANKTIGFIRSLVKKTWGNEVAKSLRIQYGGSMKPSNAKELMAMRNIDGGLIGGASLVATDFANIVNYKNN